jgi:hypothetical protein
MRCSTGSGRGVEHLVDRSSRARRHPIRERDYPSAGGTTTNARLSDVLEAGGWWQGDGDAPHRPPSGSPATTALNFDCATNGTHTSRLRSSRRHREGDV